MFANIYRAMRDVGMPNPRDVDQLEMWEIAVLIGADEYNPQTEDSEDPFVQMRADMRYWERSAGLDTSDDPPEPTADELEMMAALSVGR